MEQVTGIGGFFFRSNEPEALGQWYKDHLGIALVPEDYYHKPWSQEAGMTVFAPFPHDTEYFGRPEQQWMINFRVRNLDAMVEQLRAAKIEVTVDPETYPNGRFAQLQDPEGNPIQLWQPILEPQEVLEPPKEIVHSEPQQRVTSALRDRSPWESDGPAFLQPGV